MGEEKESWHEHRFTSRAFGRKENKGKLMGYRGSLNETKRHMGKVVGTI